MAVARMTPPRAATARPARPPSALRRAENSAAAHTKAADMAKPQRAAEAFKLDWWFTKEEKTLEALSVSVGPLPSRTGPETSMSTKNTTPATAAHRTHLVSVIAPSRSRPFSPRVRGGGSGASNAAMVTPRELRQRATAQHRR